MKAILPKLFRTVLLLVPLVCLLVTGWKYQAEAAQENRNQALIAAVRANDPGAVTRLLAGGANPNCREIPPDTRTFWQKITRFLHPVATDAPLMPSALQCAVQNNVNAPEIWENSFAILQALKERGASAAISEEIARPAQEEFDQYERKAGEADKPPPFTAQYPNDTPAVAMVQDYSESPDRFEALAAINSSGLDSMLTPIKKSLASPPPIDRTAADEEICLRDALSRCGMSVRGYYNLGRCAMMEKKYDAAVRAYRVALLWSPNYATAQAEFHEAEFMRRLYAGIESLLPPGENRTLAALPYADGSGRDLWAVVTGATKDSDLLQVRCGLYQRTGSMYRRLGQSDILRVALPWAGKWDNTKTNAVELMLRRVTGRRLPDILVCSRVVDAPDVESRLNLFAWEKERLRPVGDLNREGELKVEDLRDDGRVEITNSYRTGAVHRQTNFLNGSNIYAYRKGKLALADAESPYQIRYRTQDAESQLKEWSDDYGVRYFLAHYYSLAGRKREAALYYRQAERLCRIVVAENRNTAIRPYYRRQLQRIRARAVRLQD